MVHPAIVVVGVLLILGTLLWVNKRARMGAHVRSVDVGTDATDIHGQARHVASNLPSFLREPVFNTADHLVDPRIQAQWDAFEARHQVNAGQPNPDGLPQNGEFWPHGWTSLGPIDPLAPKVDGVARGAQDPQLAYGLSITGAVDDQERKFAVHENPNDVTHRYLNMLQQVPGSHFQVDAASDDPYKTPQVVDRFAHLPQQAAAYVVDELNTQVRESHPCFSLAGREHFELSNPPMQCGDTSSVKQSPITLIRVFESRLKKIDDGSQELFLTMEIGNMISAGSGGMFSTVVYLDNHQRFAGFEPIARDEKHTFVLPRTR